VTLIITIIRYNVSLIEGTLMNYIFLFLILFSTLSSRTFEEIKENGFINIGTKAIICDKNYLDTDVRISSIDSFEKKIFSIISRELSKHGINSICIDTRSSMREESLKNGKVDIIINSFSVTPERQQEIDFSKPYFENKGLSLLVKKGTVLKKNKLLNYQIGYESLSTAEDYLKDNKYSLNHKYDLMEEAILALSYGEIDAVIGDYLHLLDYQKAKNKFFIDYTFATTKKDYYAIGLKQKQPILKNIINNIITNNITEILALKNQSFDNSMHTLIKLNQLTANANDTIEKLHLLTERILIAFSSAIFLGIIILFISNQINKKRTKEFICKVSEIDDKMESSLNNLMIKTSSLLNVINAALKSSHVISKVLQICHAAQTA
jgi:hypothetical protein